MEPATSPASPLTFAKAGELVAAFAAEREWQPFHTPRNLLLALMSEVGEAAEILRWQGDAQPRIPEGQEQDWAHELADIQILLLRLAQVSGVDMASAFEEKLSIAKARYPVAEFRGSSRKYHQAGPPGEHRPD